MKRRARGPGPDAVVIGAGHNGLVAANLLVDAGWDVVVCEAQPRAGGAVATAEVTVPGFKSDLFSAFYPLAAASPVIQALELDKDGLAWSRAPAVLTHLLPDGRSVTLWQDASRTAESFAQFAPPDGDAWLRITGQWDRIGDAVLEVLLRPFPPVASLARLLKRLGIDEAIRLARLAAQPVRRFGEENFAGEGAPMLFAGNALHADLPPDGAGSAAFGWLLTMLGHAHGFPVPVGGAAGLVDALVRRLRRSGGELRLATPVRGITVGADGADGVVLESGETIKARRAVLADVAAPALFGMVDQSLLPARFKADLTKFQWDAPTLKIDWALDRPVPWTDDAARQSGTVHLDVDMNGLTDYAADLAAQRIPQRPFVLFGQMTTADPSRSPAGTESAWGYTHLPRGVPITDEIIDTQVDRVRSQVEAHAPGFSTTILDQHVQAPADLQHNNANLVDGAINGGTAQLHQQLVFRPVPGLGGAATPIDRLFLAGSSAHPGGGVHGACGSNAARAALTRARYTGGARRRTQEALLRRIYRDDDRPRI
ncbi:MAG TPA: NAD(P)/FAD-dependent oxidoreductase [Jatrophihabitans sp.]|jgi:phytoene dehydrogenase-like protein